MIRNLKFCLITLIVTFSFSLDVENDNYRVNNLVININNVTIDM